MRNKTADAGESVGRWMRRERLLGLGVPLLQLRDRRVGLTCVLPVTFVSGVRPEFDVLLNLLF